MADLNKILLYRITHLQNIPHILQHGITHISSPNKNKAFVSIGDSSLITSRSFFTLPNGSKLGDYIPFYFGVRMPMLYVIQNGFNGVKAIAAKDIVYCVTSVAAIIKSGVDFIFTNGHAIDSFSEFFGDADVNDIESLVDFKAVNTQYWKSDTDLDLKRRKEAEFLVMGDVAKEAIIGFAVYASATAEGIKALPGFADKKIVVKPNYYF